MNKEVGWQAGGGVVIAKKTQLKFHFYNPNSAEETAEYITRIFIQVNQAKMDQILQEASESNGDAD